MSHVSKSSFVDVDRKEVLNGLCPSANLVRPSPLANHNISFYHTVHKRCTAHVVGEIAPDDGIEGATLLLRYFYRYDEDDVVAADNSEKQVQSALKGRTYFKKVPRLWSNHFAIAKVRNPRLEDAISFCEPSDYTHLEVCCFFRFELPSKRIAALPAYLKNLGSTIPEIVLSQVPESIAPKAKQGLADGEAAAPTSSLKRKRRSGIESGSTSPRDHDSRLMDGPSPKRSRVSTSSDELSDEGSSSSILYDRPSPVSSSRSSLDLSHHQIYSHPQFMLMQQPAPTFYPPFFPGANPAFHFGRFSLASNALGWSQAAPQLPPLRNLALGSPSLPPRNAVGPQQTLGLDSLIEAMFESGDSETGGLKPQPAFLNHA